MGEATPDPYSQVLATIAALAGNAAPEKAFREFLFQGFLAGAFLFFTVHPLAAGQDEMPTQSEAMEISIPA